MMFYLCAALTIVLTIMSTIVPDPASDLYCALVAGAAICLYGAIKS